MCASRNDPEPVIHVWNMQSEEELTVLDPAEHLVFGGDFGGNNLLFTADGHLLTTSEPGLLRLDLNGGQAQLVREGNFGRFVASADGRRILAVDCGDQDPSDLAPGSAVVLDLKTNAVTPLGTHGDNVTAVAIDPSGAIAISGDTDGVVRVGPVTGEESHLFLGHEKGLVSVLAMDPLGRWVASGGNDDAVRLWPMPDLSQPSLHTLPREELIAKLKTLTNLRVVRDEDSPTGWKFTHDPFPGWETVPTW